MSTKIMVDRFYGKNIPVSRYIINETISNNDDIDVDEIFYNKDGSVVNTSKMSGADEDVIIDEFFSNRPNVAGEYSKINIESLSEADVNFFNKLFSNNYEIPDCVEFKVSPDIQLTNLPKINANTEKDVCPICLDDLYDQPVSYISGNKGNVNYCSHKFHTKCINEYCSRNDNCVCPICRQKIEHGSIRPLSGGKKKQTKRKYKFTKRNKYSKRRHSKRKTRRGSSIKQMS